MKEEDHAQHERQEVDTRDRAEGHAQQGNVDGRGEDPEVIGDGEIGEKCLEPSFWKMP